MTINELKELLASGEFRHATYRPSSGLWSGLWIYRKAIDGFRGFEPAGFFSRTDPNLDAAERLVAHTGISVGAYGNG